MNVVNLIGRLARDPELRFTPSGTAVANFTLAVRNPFKEEGEGADFINCVAWQKGAELVAEHHEKGNMIGVEGRLQTRDYERDDGSRVYVTEVNVERIHFIQTKNYNANGDNGNTKTNKPNGNNRNNRNGTRSGNRTNTRKNK